MRRSKFKTYLPFTLNVFQRQLSYKGNVLMFLLGEAMVLAVTYYLWRAIYVSSSSAIIEGFTLKEMIIYVLISFLTALMTSADITYEINMEVKSGSIGINLIRPVSYEMRMFFQALGTFFYNFIIVFILAFTLITLLFYSYGEGLSLGNILLYIVSLLLGFIINFYYSYAFGLLSFKITNMWGMSQVMGAIMRLLSGALIPITFFPKVIQSIIGFFPFSSLIYTPTMIYLGKLAGAELIKALALQLFWVVIMAMIARLIWKALVKNITILGG
ncbi:MAG: ABC transporter permease [Clostridiaceae bacterium]